MLAPGHPTLLANITELWPHPEHQHDAHRHAAALNIMGVGSAAEVFFLVLVILFGSTALVASTWQSIQAAVAGGGAGDACYAST